ncbi:MAG: hypothetical protein JWQ08_690 [Deinococcus sp.]|nr:hypothetical protein [Deinococcus sp.]
MKCTPPAELRGEVKDDTGFTLMGVGTVGRILTGPG